MAVPGASVPDIPALAPSPVVDAPAASPYSGYARYSGYLGGQSLYSGYRADYSGYAAQAAGAAVEPEEDDEPAASPATAEQAPEGGAQAAAEKFDGSKHLDYFGRDLGWDQMPAEPADAPSSIKQISLAPSRAHYTPSPEDWRDGSVYALLWDRFEREAPYSTWGDPSKASTRHGGNIKGAMLRLPYLERGHVKTIVVNSVTMNPPAGYHQYWSAHFLAVDPQIGTMADFKKFVDEAHKRGMRVVLDMVFNHTGPVAEYEGGFHFGPPKKIAKWNYQIKPVELQREEHFSRRGDIGDWNNKEQVQYGDLPGGINRLDTDNPATQDILLKIAKYWIKETDIDGFRLDVYKHVSPKMWDRVFKEIREYAASLGKKNFWIGPGELYDGDPDHLAPEVKPGKLDSAYNYPAYYWDMAALRGQEPTYKLEESFHKLKDILGESLGRLVRFLDNHDRPRFLKEGEPLGRLKAAVAYIMTTVGIPYVFYGTEQGLRSTAKREKELDLEASRDDLFPAGKFRDPKAPGFDEKSEMYRHIAALGALREKHPALRRGEQFVRWSDKTGAGLFAFSRIYGDEEVLVAINTAGAPQLRDMWVDAQRTGPDADLVDELDPSYVTKTWAQDGGARVVVAIPAYGARVLVRRAKTPAK